MGSVFGVPVVKEGELPGLKVALVPGEGEPLRSVEPGGQLTLMIGGEREGLPGEVVGDADVIAHIPIATDSLNAAMAATVALYELSHRISPR
jgi:TrmH family RNA methyltransferase